ncbi:MAG: hypothetical protein DMF89_13215 [Acidobacteria bacterium]|nr:MAG: hypothetical protein DMF89_13215 [Acidobacteriota bacterium]
MTSNSTSVPVVSRRQSRTLDGFVADVCRPGSQGLRLPSLQPLTRLMVTTRNTTYHIVARGGTKVLVKGGRFFPQYTDARLAGSGHGGSLLKLDWIAIGLRMELWSDGRAIVTSPVRAIAVEPEPAAPVS